MTDNKPTTKDYVSSLKPIWCPGCGDYGVLNAFAEALAELGRPTEEIAIISGIGCSSRLPGYLNTYSFNAIHGRALPIACGLKIARPGLQVIAVGGDGDGFSIGSGHINHVVRRNVDITYVVMDNNIYGLTKGQLSPTTPTGDITSTTKYGSIDVPILPLRQMLGYRATFVAQSTPLDVKHLAKMILKAMQHPGFAFVNIISPCVTYRGREMYQLIRERMYYVDETPGYDPTDDQKAWGLISRQDRYSLGIIYQKPGPTYAEKLRMLEDKAKAGKEHSLEELRRSFLP